MNGIIGEVKRTRGFKKKERTRKLLLDAGLRAFAERGEALTISDVVTEAEVSNGTFYNYFVDRDALFDALAEQLALDAADRFFSVIDASDPALRFAIMSASVLARAAADRTWGRVILRLEALRKDSRELADRSHLVEDLCLGYEQGRFAVGASDATIDLIVASQRITIRRIVAGLASREYVLAAIANLLCALGIERVEALEIAELAADRVELFARLSEPTQAL